jgi:hypothetical protein
MKMVKVRISNLYGLAWRINEYRNVLRFCEKIVFSKKKIDLHETILIAGVPRSGTTWLMDIIKNIPGYTWFFEPINPVWFPESFKIGFKSRTYLPAEKDWQDGEEFLKKVFTGKVYSRIPPYLLDPKETACRLLGHKLIVKTIRLNRLLPWINKRFKLRDILLIIRHPCAVIASQMNTGFYGYHPSFPPYYDAFPSIKNILDEASEIYGLNDGILNRLQKIKTKEEILAAAWCLDYIVPLKVRKPFPWKIVFYEELVKNGKKVVEDLLYKLGERKIIDSVVKRLNKPSVVAPKGSTKFIRSNIQLSKGRRVLSDKQVNRILKVVADFGLNFYSEKLEPDYDSFHLYP